MQPFHVDSYIVESFLGRPLNSRLDNCVPGKRMKLQLDKQLAKALIIRRLHFERIQIQ